jgi:hypothetical protein
VVRVAVRDEDGRYIDRWPSTQRLEALCESAIRQTGIDEEPRPSGIQQ